ncbi:programmed cell death 1 ligand 2-like isoform X2 [Hypanus sabinus]|nr:programmed cell death 1 ligand 2-like isoform X2 [Hypanus sabinus]XP_059804652.1 programmed cell death 1 ligand 2-like isoform X2 [Hypanus sabinus]XP_059804653.1 programmed cell death 1 ligand 2-like isoform X2 [Hypanus sabinus]
MKGILEMDLNLQIYCYLVLCANVYSVKAFVTLKCEETVTGILNEDTILPCNLTTTESTKPKLKYIELRKDDGDDTLVFKFNGSHNPRKAQDRIQLLSLDPQNVSLVLQKTQLLDSGKYNYYLETNQGHPDVNIVLVVKAPYSLPKLALVILTEMTKVVTCETTGYPSAQIHWTVNGKNLTLSSETKRKETAQGLISINSTLPIITSETDQEHNYTCAVWNEAERKYEARNSITIAYQPIKNQHTEGRKRKSLTAVGVVVGGFAAGIFLLGLLKFRRKNHLVRQFNEEAGNQMLKTFVTQV